MTKEDNDDKIKKKRIALGNSDSCVRYSGHKNLSRGTPSRGTFPFSETGFFSLYRKVYGLTNVKRYDKMAEEKSVIRQR